MHIKITQLQQALEAWMTAENCNKFNVDTNAVIAADPDGNVGFWSDEDSCREAGDYKFVILRQHPPMFRSYVLGMNVATPKHWMNKYHKECNPHGTAVWITKNFIDMQALQSAFKRARQDYTKWGRENWALACEPANHNLWLPYAT